MKYFIFFLLILGLSQRSRADAVYPQPPDIRPLGLQQGDVGSCMAEAEVSAMENAFSARGYAVRLSDYHAHAYNWRKNHTTNQGEILQTYLDGADNKIFNYFGRFVPYYMLPEDGRGFYLQPTARPPISEYGVYDKAFPSAAETGQSATSYGLAPGYSNSVGLDALKSWVRQKLPVTLGVQGYILNLYDPQTGLLDEPYKFLAPQLSNQNGVTVSKHIENHSVALVGFDDSLIPGPGLPPGALIIRNSWNENATIKPLSGPVNQIKDKAGFARFRAKINPNINDPGYYALPYQYIQDLSTHKIGSATLYNINYARFYQAYINVKSRYQVRRVPFYCNSDTIPFFIRNYYPQYLRGIRGGDPKKKAEDISNLTYLFSPSSFTSNVAYVSLAKVSVDRAIGVDRVRDFYEGKFKTYYCGSFFGFGPNVDIMNREDFNSAIDQMSTDPSSIGSWLSVYRMLYNYLGELKQ